MKHTTLASVAKMAEGIILHGNPSTSVHSAHFDARLLEAGALFVPIVGSRDGHDFISQAIEQGASAALISNQDKIPQDSPENFGYILVNDTLRAFQKMASAYRKSFHMPFVAVTGSNGKTTTKDIIAHVLSQRNNVYKTFKNLNNHLGVPYSLLQLDDSHEVAVLELGMSHAGEIDLLADMLHPDYSVITHIGDAHLEFFGTREKIALAKAELLPHTNPAGLVLLNGDSEYLRKVSHLYDGEVWFYSVNEQADIWADQITSDGQGTHYTVHIGSTDRLEVFLPLFGKHNVANSLPAIAIALRMGMTRDEIIAALATVHISAMRFEVNHSSTGAIIINDAYNASPSSMKAAIDTFAEIFPERQKILVLGDMYELGENSGELHADIGIYLNQFEGTFEHLITVGVDAAELSHTFQGKKNHFKTKEEAEQLLAQYNSAEYAILFKASRGMKLESLLEIIK
ncbi:UDP-N-acetylmuramoyl-tripeptide--D-alanyl-D-alanine ligase [Brevibacillus sp. SYSU BS000544]|uniref:UDP-N-acetylmuramoyl-tripeptide--D-alanyl-D- alanine ligase n=1 Tax=Brevibacillus sp. SYSU BS000544 TaxID=3416443 RepID=UPI003CE5AE06